ncbi:helix-turn-helix domain-containing protein [Novosphingobium sp. RD2P27]|uniref:Helix-turn-helix domain-containing protein n=1 Tax=Novosphingobium kalidii TaxID=3230299 RepID=A0ABV2D0A3_9SPHN
MEDHNDIQSTAPTSQRVGEQLRAAREQQGLSRGDIAARTRVAERHLIAIEEDNFSDLAAPTYAVGFSRAYARAVGLDEADVARRVRQNIDAQAHTRPAPVPSFEPGDPARVPPSLFAWIAGIVAAVLVVAALVYWSDLLAPQGELPDLAPAETQAVQQPAAAPAPVVQPQPAAPTGPVVLTAAAPAVWIKVTDAAGNQVFQKELAQGESYTVPADVQGPQLRTGRPDVLQITVGGRAVPPLGDSPQVISGVLLTPEALLERSRTPAPATAAPPSVSSATGAGVRGAQPSVSLGRVGNTGGIGPATAGSAPQNSLSTTQQ